MHEQGYSSEEIADAAGSGLAPWEWQYISTEWVDSQLESEPEEPFKSRDEFPFSTLKQTEIFVIYDDRYIGFTQIVNERIKP